MSSITKIEIYSAIGSKIKEYRVKNNMTQEELARKVGKSKNWVKNNEQGLNRYFFEDLIKIATICNVDIIIKDKKYCFNMKNVRRLAIYMILKN